MACRLAFSSSLSTKAMKSRRSSAGLGCKRSLEELMRVSLNPLRRVPRKSESDERVSEVVIPSGDRLSRQAQQNQVAGAEPYGEVADLRTKTANRSRTGTIGPLVARTTSRSVRRSSSFAPRYQSQTRAMMRSSSEGTPSPCTRGRPGSWRRGPPMFGPQHRVGSSRQFDLHGREEPAAYCWVSIVRATGRDRGGLPLRPRRPLGPSSRTLHRVVRGR